MTGGAGFGLYVHWPFCRSKCPYCDFNSRPARGIDQPRWLAAMLAELDHYAALSPGRRLTSLFFGGGTPSLLDPDAVARLIDRARRHWGFAPTCEVTLEANPDSVEPGRLRALRDGGVNRLSLGVQSLDDRALAWLGRPHDAARARDAVAQARAVFTRVSIDLIHSRPGQTLADWRDELIDALGFGCDHLSLYQLTIEPETAFGRRGVVAPGDEQGRAMLDLTREVTAAAGLPAYEVSNHARPGAECRHNLTYWRGGDWVGLGPGAHGRLGRRALAQNPDPERWLAEVEARGHGTVCDETLSPADLVAERVMMGLRLAEGIDLAALASSCGLDPGQVVDRAGLDRLVEAGLVGVEGTRLRATTEGWALLDSVLVTLLP